MAMQAAGGLLSDVAMGAAALGGATSASSPALTESGPAPHADLSHALWLHASLRSNKHRLSDGDGAALYFVPAFGSLSEATGTCEGTTHMQRMAAAAKALTDHPWFAKFPSRHVVFAGATSEDRTPLGELGAVLSKGGAIGVCTSRTYCSARFSKRAEVPMLPLLSLMNPSVHPKLTSEACPRGGPGVSAAPVKRRSTLLFYRGAHGTSDQSQEVRARLWELRTMAGADIKFSRGGPVALKPSIQQRMKSLGWSGRMVTMPFNTHATAYGMLHSDFCAIPRGEGPNPGRRLVDAVAAGCVPLLLGDNLRPPLSSLLKYTDFTVRVPEAEFLRYPKGAVSDALAAATPRLAELRRNLIRARDELLLGYGDAPIPTNFSAAKGADLVLLKAGQAFCPRSPATFRSCTEGMV